MVGSDIMCLIIDSLLAVLLLGAMIASFVLYRKLDAMRAGQEEMSNLINGLNKAVVDAQTNIAELKKLAQETEDKLGTEMNKARSVTDELSMIVQAGNNLADRIEKSIERNLQGGAPMAGYGAKPPMTTGGGMGHPSGGGAGHHDSIEAHAARVAAQEPAGGVKAGLGYGQTPPKQTPSAHVDIEKQKKLLSALKQAR